MQYLWGSFHSKSCTVHLGMHTRENPYQCSQCEMYFKEKTIIKVDIITFTVDKPYLYR